MFPTAHWRTIRLRSLWDCQDSRLLPKYQLRVPEHPPAWRISHIRLYRSHLNCETAHRLDIRSSYHLFAISMRQRELPHRLYPFSDSHWESTLLNRSASCTLQRVGISPMRTIVGDDPFSHCRALSFGFSLRKRDSRLFSRQ